MIEFYRDVLDGPLYWIVLLVSLVLIMSIIGYVMDKRRIAKENENSAIDINNTIEDDLSYNDILSNIDNSMENIVPEENAATNVDIPEVLDFNSLNNKYTDENRIDDLDKFNNDLVNTVSINNFDNDKYQESVEIPDVQIYDTSDSNIVDVPNVLNLDSESPIVETSVVENPTVITPINEVDPVIVQNQSSVQPVIKSYGLPDSTLEPSVSDLPNFAIPVTQEPPIVNEQTVVSDIDSNNDEVNIPSDINIDNL